MDGSMALPFDARVDSSSSLTPYESPPSLPTPPPLLNALPQLHPMISENSIANPNGAAHMERAVAESGPPPPTGNAITSGSNTLLSGLKSALKIGARVLAAPLALMGFLAAKAVTLVVASIPAFVVGILVGTFPVWSCLWGLGGDTGVEDIIAKGIEAGAYLGNKLSEASGFLITFALNDPKMGEKFEKVSKDVDEVVAVLGGAAGGVVGLGLGAIGTVIGGLGTLFVVVGKEFL